MKLLLTFFTSFVLAYFTLNFAVYKINQREERVQHQATQILQQEISQKFQLALDVTLVIGQMSSAFIFNESNLSSYDEFIEPILKEKPYILGLNQLDAQGKIINIFPQETNENAMGKVSQSVPMLLESYQKGEKFWFSPPIKLFQGTTGFIFYIPIHNKNKLLGWMASVISSDLFFEHFRNMDFFHKYELIIKDESSGNVYFETALPPQEGYFEDIKSSLWGRSITFQSWPKITHAHFEIPFYLRFLSSLFFAFALTFFMKEHLQKQKAYSRLEDISDVLKITSNEILSKIMDIQNDYLSKEDSFVSSEATEKEIQSVNNLFEQIELLQNIASSEHFDEETFEILPLLKEQFLLLREIISKKNLYLQLDSESFNEVKLTGNKWLISNTVLKNVLSFSALISRPDGKIEVTHTVSPRECSTIFYIENIIEEEMSKAFRIDRRLLVAQNVMNILNGEITIREDSSGGMIVKLSTIKDM